MRRIIFKQWIIRIVLIFLSISALVIVLVTKKEKRNNQKERAIEVIFWNPTSPIKFDTAYGPYKKIVLTGFEKVDSLRLIEIRSFLIEYKKTNKSNCGVHIVFEDNSKYGDFIKVVDYCLQESVKVYAPYKNNIWIPTSRNMKE